LREMVLPGALTILTPIVVVFIPMLFGYNNLEVAEMLGGYMAGVTVSGVMWAIFQNNAGGAWDNAKKSFEAGVMIDGEMTFKGSDAHKAAVTGDTVGDPFKDTSGPSMNILIKLTCLVGLVIAPILGSHSNEITSPLLPENQIEESVEMKKVIIADTTGANVEIEEKTVNGESTVSILSGNITAVSDKDLLKLKTDGFDLSKFIPAERWNNLETTGTETTSLRLETNT